MVVLSLAACSHSSTPPPSAHYMEFADHQGSQVVLAHKPQNVAVLFSSFADIWTTAGGTVNITVAESVERGFFLLDFGATKARRDANDDNVRRGDYWSGNRRFRALS